MNVFELFAKISLDTSDYEKGLNESSRKTESFASKLKNGLATAAKVGAAALTAASTAVVALTKSAVDNYAEYEQLVGGVETLFKKSQDKVMDYANNAFKTAGLSANEYMETVTSFSASLLQSLGGDTDKAADMADKAITDMSDNANKMGSDITLLQNAYRGFAKQNFTMLDNLSLGYGGTKEEMERLLEDAGKLANTKFDISSYADIIEAIHVMQEEMGIAGTTAKEASTTIQGSLAAMKSAWQNLVTGIADPTQDLSVLIDNFVDSVGTAAGNLIPRVKETLKGIVQLISGIAPMITAEIPALVNDVLPSVLDGATEIISAVVGVVPDLISTLTNVISEQSPYLMQSGLQILLTLISGITQNIDAIVSAAVTIAEELANFINENANILVEAAIELITTIVSALSNPDNLISLATAAITILEALASAIIENLPKLIESGKEIVSALIEGAGELFPKLIEAFEDAVSEIGEQLAEQFPALSAVFENLVPIIEAVIAAIVAFKAVMAISSLVSGVTTAIKGLGAALTFLAANPVGAVVAAIAGLITLIVSLWKNNEDFRNAVIKIWNSIKETFAKAWEGIKNIFAGIGDWFANRWSDIKNAFANVGEWFSDKFNTAKENIKTSWQNIGSWFGNRWQDIKNAFADVGSWFENKFTAAKNAIMDAWNAVQGLKDVGSGVVGGINAGLNAALSSLNSSDNFANSLDFNAQMSYNRHGNNAFGGRGGGINVTQNIYSQAKTAADLMEEARYNFDMAVSW